MAFILTCHYLQDESPGTMPGDFFGNPGLKLSLLALLLCGVFSWQSAVAQSPAESYDADEALRISTGAVGAALPDLTLKKPDGTVVRLRHYTGRPILISMIFTSCYHVCPAITRHLKSAVDEARDTLGDDSFQVLTIGFDTANDSPLAMGAFAAKQNVHDDNWDFLSASANTIGALTEAIGFVYFPSPRGFDHINQVTVVDRDGIIYRQVYGAAFDLPWLMEPLKQVVFNQPESGGQIIDGLWDRVRLFCTVYDPRTGRYRFDYSLFVQIGIGALVILSVLIYLIIEYRRSRRGKSGG
jgi:protein SCO1/2